MISFSTLFKKENEPIITCSCGNIVLLATYNKRLRKHIIGMVAKNNKSFSLYCDGKERK